jgi:hypothetical protein
MTTTGDQWLRPCVKDPRRGRTGKRGPRAPLKPYECSYRKPNNKLSMSIICYDPNCKSARSRTAAKKFIARRDSGERAAKRARNERESAAFD